LGCRVVSADTLSDVLGHVRLSGAVFFDIDATAPWVAESPAAREVAPYILPGAEHVIEYHLVVSGRCYGGIVGTPQVELRAGDLVIFPQGDAHVMSSSPGMRAKPDLEVHQRPPGALLPIALEMNGGGEHTAVICGFLGCDARPFNPLLAALPRTLLVRGSELAPSAQGLARALPNGSSLGLLTELALAESKARRAGGECALSRLSELMFVEAVRRYVDSLPPGQDGWLAGLRDPHVGRALALLHEHPARAWSLDDLARDAGQSRSLLAERFVQLVGLPPMQYLAKWRMQLAAERLRATNEGLSQIAERVGYGSESAFSRAFKRLVGVAPAVFRQGPARLEA